jgi:signal transduction histidine kinase
MKNSEEGLMFILIQLLENSVKYTNPGGTIYLKIKNNQIKKT